MAAGDLCTLAQVREWLSLAVGQTGDNALLERLITACSAGIKDYVQRPLLSETYSESYNGTGTSKLVLKNYPITAVSNLLIGNVAVTEASDPTAYGFLFNGAVLYLSSAGAATSPNVGNIFPAGNQNVQVTYTAGYASTPDDIVQACVEFVAYKYQQRKHTGRKSDNIQAGGMGTTYQEGYMPPEVKAMLNKYKRVVPT
jgi:uncharacterized phiE125 gp8 family phage protein